MAQGSRSRREYGETCVSLVGMSGKPADATLVDNTSVCACGDTEMMSLVRMLTSLGRTHRPDHGHVNHEVPQPQGCELCNGLQNGRGLPKNTSDNRKVNHKIKLSI